MKGNLEDIAHDDVADVSLFGDSIGDDEGCGSGVQGNHP